jgi:hypothetical protein
MHKSPASQPLPEMAGPFLTLIDDLLAIETPAMAWLRQIGPIAEQMNEEARGDEHA